ncbi:MAG: hypothetical protein E7568_05160 [Ruminococcaceae bacterium]|nr:hypothetical protein [Oscillospiraceae bacterium]
MKFGPDWNGNGKTDAFDHYMNMKVMEASSKDSVSGKSSGGSTKATGSDEKPEVTGISMFGKPMYDATKDSNGVTILKSLLVVGLCIAGIAIPVVAEMEGLAVALFPLGAVGLSVLIMKNT